MASAPGITLKILDGKQMKHTPGPWNVFRTPSGYDHIRGPKNQRISHEVSDIEEVKEANANASLISAAPEMYELLKKIQREINVELEGRENIDFENKLNLVIAKAEGK